MFRRLKLQGKLLLSYSIIILILLLSISIPAYIYLNNTVIRNTNETIRQDINRITDSLDSFVDIGNTVTKIIYYNSSLMGALKTLKQNASEAEVGAAYKEVNADAFLLGSINSNFKRLNIYTEKGDFFSNKASDKTVKEVEAKDKLMEKAQNAQGAVSLSYYENDPWTNTLNRPVLTFSRQITWNSAVLGFLEIQMDLRDVFNEASFSGIKSGQMCVFGQKGILYSTIPTDNEKLVDEYKKNIGSKKQGEFDISISGRKEHIIYKYSGSAQNYVLYSIPQSELYETVNIVRTVVWLVFISLSLVSILVVLFMARVLTKPIREVNRSLKDEDILATGITIENREANDELEEINHSFNRMRIRLKKTMEENIKSRTLQLKAQFDALQAQISPHFFFNMLGIIAISSSRNGAKDAADMCRKLASFLRYSITTGPAYCQISDEIQFVKEYLELLKYRYVHRLEFNIDIDPKMLKYRIPKLSLQPLIENCIVHGFKEMEDVMEIYVCGVMYNGKWELSIRDNGSGIAEEILQQIKNKLQEYTSKLCQGLDTTDILAGKMGIVNTYARLELLYKNKIEFEIWNNEDKGTSIKISGTAHESEEEEDSNG
jgi:two-component system sensor histidine kinase YesM